MRVNGGYRVRARLDLPQVLGFERLVLWAGQLASRLRRTASRRLGLLAGDPQMLIRCLMALGAGHKHTSLGKLWCFKRWACQNVCPAEVFVVERLGVFVFKGWACSTSDWLVFLF